MTEEEYLELKEYLKKGIAYADELRKQLPSSNKLLIPSFLPCETKLLSDEDIKYRDVKLDLMQKLGWQEIDNDLAAELIYIYEVDKDIK